MKYTLRGKETSKCLEMPIGQATVWCVLSVAAPKQAPSANKGDMDMELSTTLRVVSLTSFILVASLLTGCGSKATDPGGGNSHQTEFTDDELLEAAYSDYLYPEDFYHEVLNGRSIYYENTISITPIEEREHIWIELCTESYEEAYAWSEASARNSAYYRELVSQRETEKYFEFTRVRPEHLTDVILSRVHKRSYIDRTMYDRFLSGDTLGIFNKRPLSVRNVEEMLEYLWFTREAAGQKVLSSFAERAGNGVKHTIYAIRIVYGDWGIRDRITLYRYEYAVDGQSGVLVLSSKVMIRELQGR